MDKLVPGSSSRVSDPVIAAAPPTMTGLSPYMSGRAPVPFLARVALDKTAGAWGISSVSVRVFAPRLEWKTPAFNNSDSLRLTVRSLHVILDAAKRATPTGASEWRYNGTIGGQISLYKGQFQLAAEISYASDTKTLTLFAAIPDSDYSPFSVMAWDNIFLPALLEVDWTWKQQQPQAPFRRALCQTAPSRWISSPRPLLKPAHRASCP